MEEISMGTSERGEIQKGFENSQGKEIKEDKK
jgi:hypothetical protein